MSFPIPFTLQEHKKLSKDKDFFFDEYNYYFNEREKIQKEITYSLNDKVSVFKFKNWFRLTSTKYSNHPLSCKGSVKNASGGRFNIGSIKEDRYSTFPALYLGNKKDTCIKEVYKGVEHFFNTKQGDSFYLVSGQIDLTLNITKKGSLDNFIKVIKKIKLSEKLKKRARKINLDKRYSIQSVAEMKKAIYDPNWKLSPNILDIPSPSQIFGQLVKKAGIEAIVYKSTKKSREGLCLAVFPENFKNSESYVHLEECSDSVQHKEINAHSYENFF